MSAKRFTGKTESDAVMNAAMELGIPSTDLKYTVCLLYTSPSPRDCS